MNEFLHMGGYAAYIWPAYGVVAVVMIGLLMRTIKTLRTNERTLAALEQAGAKRIHEQPVQHADKVSKTS